ncbi:16861_t:CDS:2 [Funneliformis mosseae]|uniref:16861_t:CDS:1 n=1 Tax=Funneliformis mosseae TaxID=27381 RepID=A0A9N9BPG7_FUNMO|nr:16861_t:CDS:2 [Funneliformis mosseae]
MKAVTQKEEDIQDNLNDLLNNNIITVQNKNTGAKRGRKKKQQEIVDSSPPLSLNDNTLESSNEPDSLNKLSRTVSSPSRLTRSTPLKSRDNALN